MELQSNIDEINDYLASKLEGKALEAFENRLENDIALQQEVAYYKDLFTDLRQAHFQQIRAKGEKILKEMEEPIRSRNFFSSYTRWLSLALFLLGLILGLIYYFDNNKSTTPETLAPIALAQEAWKSGPQLPYFSLRNKQDLDSLDKIVFQAFEAYTKKDYVKMNLLLAEFDKETPKYEDALLLRALAHYEQQNYTAAVKLLEIGLQHSPNNQIVLMQWYQSLILLEMGQIAEAKHLLQKIVSDQNQASPDAQQLLEQL